MIHKNEEKATQKKKSTKIWGRWTGKENTKVERQIDVKIQN